MSSWWPSAWSAWPSSPSEVSQSTPATPPPTNVASDSAKCPVDHTKIGELSPDHLFYKHQQEHLAKVKASTAATAPAASVQSSSSAGRDETSAQCPVDHTKMGSLPPDHPFYKHQQDYLRKQEAESTKERINPRNMMPELSQSPHPEQRVVLPTERTFSTIPKSESTDMDEKSYGAKTDTTWVYPSPQQFYNALKRKGWETPEEEIPVMVQIHNFLNEACWHEILRWERMHQTACGAPTLLRFQGRPSELSPKARLYTTLLGTPPPFDRHDWTVDRCGKPVRYVIDYYSGPDEVDGNPSFIVDVRPALDSPTAVVDRLRMVMKSFTDRWSSGEAAPQT